MQIDWDKAPDWANYAAMDEDGCWCWFEGKPEIFIDAGRWDLYEGRMELTGELGSGESWQDSIILHPAYYPATLNALDNDYFA